MTSDNWQKIGIVAGVVVAIMAVLTYFHSMAPGGSTQQSRASVTIDRSTEGESIVVTVDNWGNADVGLSGQATSVPSGTEIYLVGRATSGQPEWNVFGPFAITAGEWQAEILLGGLRNNGRVVSSRTYEVVAKALDPSNAPTPDVSKGNQAFVSDPANLSSPDESGKRTFTVTP